MAKFTVWTNTSDRKAVNADDPREAAALYHQTVGALPDAWDGTLCVRNEEGQEWSFKRRQA
jgi:hypothetical protein